MKYKTDEERKLAKKAAYRKWYEANELKEKERLKKYREDHKEEIIEYKKEWDSKNSEKLKEHQKKYRQSDPEKIKKNKKKYRDKPASKEKKKLIAKRYWIVKKDEIRLRLNNYIKNKRRNDPTYRLYGNLRALIYQHIKKSGFTKKTKTINILGCTPEFLKAHITTQWAFANNLDKNGNIWMNWDNYGKYNGEFNYGWDIDHIIPISSAKTEEDVIRLNHYTNLQPLCSYINRVIKRNN